MNEQLKAEAIYELEKLLSELPEVSAIKNDVDTAVRWNAVLGRVLSKVKKPSLRREYESIRNASDKKSAHSPIGLNLPGPDHYRKKLRSCLVYVIEELKYDCKEHGSTVLAPGATFDYFDDIRKKIEIGSSDIFFIDPYLDADFIGTYMPFVKDSASVRLLTSGKQTSLQAASAAKLFTAQHGVPIETRQSDDTLHDRWLIVDGNYCYQSGASFKDGAVKSSTSIIEVINIAPELIAKFNEVWGRSSEI